MVYFFHILTLFFIINCAIFTLQKTNNTLRITKSIQHKSRTLVPLLLINSTNYQHLKQRHNCKWLRGYKYQRNQCKNRRGLSNILSETRQLVINNCANQFRNYRWNCTIKKDIFTKTLRETAYIQSLTSAALMYTISLACTDGKLQNCSCAKESKIPKNKHKWQWNGCGDNIKDGNLITTKFLRLRNKSGDDQDKLFKINSKIGMKSVAKNAMKTCICHGVSGSCTMKTCVRRLNQFNLIAEDLKGKYHNALQVTSGVGFRERLLKLKDSLLLLFDSPSPNFCDLTIGGRCKDPDHCATYCCGRGHNIMKKQIKTKCNFKMFNNTTVHYEICSEDGYFCK